MRSRKVGTFIIANAALNSDEVLAEHYDTADVLCLHCPAALTGTLSVQAKDSLGNFGTVEDPPGTALAGFAANDRVIFTVVPGQALRVVSTLAEGAQRLVELWGRESRIG